VSVKLFVKHSALRGKKGISQLIYLLGIWKFRGATTGRNIKNPLCMVKYLFWDCKIQENREHKCINSIKMKLMKMIFHMQAEAQQ